jgi:ketosteroid isomerase-like protein
MTARTTTTAQLHDLLQRIYFDGIDNADAGAAAEAMHEDVEWIHTQVWEHDGHSRSKTDTLHGRDSVREFLAARIKEMQVEGIKHQLRKVITEGDTGAFRAEVVGPAGVFLAFFGWVELKDKKIITYIVGPAGSL